MESTVNGLFGFATCRPRETGMLVMEMLSQNKEKRKEVQAIAVF